GDGALAVPDMAVGRVAGLGKALGHGQIAIAAEGQSGEAIEGLALSNGAEKDVEQTLLHLQTTLVIVPRLGVLPLLLEQEAEVVQALCQVRMAQGIAFLG